MKMNHVSCSVHHPPLNWMSVLYLLFKICPKQVFTFYCVDLHFKLRTTMFNIVNLELVNYWPSDITNRTHTITPAMTRIQIMYGIIIVTSSERHGVSNRHQSHCFFNVFLRRITKEARNICIARLLRGDSPVTGGLPSKRLVMWKIFPCHDIIGKLWAFPQNKDSE